MSLSIIDTSKLIIDGRAAAKAYADLHSAIVETTMHETITGASTVTMRIEDPKRILVRSGTLAVKTTCQIDGAGFELVAVRKSGNSLEADWEDMAVAALRRHRTYRKVAAGTMTRAAFCQLLIREEPWITVNAAPGALSKVELARGSANPTTTVEAASGTTGGLGNYGLDPAAGTSGALSASAAKVKKATAKDLKIAAGLVNAEDTWAAAGRIMGEIGWRVYALRQKVTIAPDLWILTRGTPYALTEASPGVDSIDWDYDTGKPAAAATVRLRCGTTTSFPVGSRVTFTDQGPANGDWLVESIDRSDRDDYATAKLVRPQPVLAEPVASTAAALLGNGGLGGYGMGLVNPNTPTGSPAADALVERFVSSALELRGRPYVWGAAGPNAFDCSHLVQWAASHVGFSFPAPVGSQLAMCRRAGTLMSVEQAIATRGALLIHGPNTHIAISLGNGQTMEAKGKAYGCDVFPASGRGWTTGAYVPGVPVSVRTDRSGRAS